MQQQTFLRKYLDQAFSSPTTNVDSNFLHSPKFRYYNFNNYCNIFKVEET